MSNKHFLVYNYHDYVVDRIILQSFMFSSINSKTAQQKYVSCST